MVRMWEMLEPKLGLTVNLIAGGLAFLVAVFLPLAYFLIQYQHESASVETRAEMYAALVDSALPAQKIASLVENPETVVHVRQILSVRMAYTDPEMRRLVDERSGFVSEFGQLPPLPLITRTANVTVAALPVARIEVSHTLYPLLIGTTLMAVLSIALGYGVFVLFRAYPLRAFRMASEELKMRQQAEDRLQKSLSVLGATLESTADGILVIDALGRVAGFNDRFLELWQISEKEKKAVDNFQILTVISHHVVNPENFIAKLRQLKDAPPPHDQDIPPETLELLDGRAFEVTMKAQRIEGATTGWVLSFHDISERKRSETLLTREKQVLEMILQGQELDTILGFLARYLEKQAKQMFCTILVPDEQGVLRRAAGTNLPAEFIAAIAKAASLPSLKGSGSSWKFAGTGIVQVMESVDWQGYTDLAREQGLQPWWASPISGSDGEVLGAVVAHYRLGMQPDPDDAKLLELTADLTRIVLERKQSESRLEYLAHYDALTGLPNRVLFRDRLDHAVSRAERNGEMLAVMFLDLDRFKTVNDTLGHAVGDRLLKEVAARLQVCMRENDTVARLGGDEFTLLLEGIASPEDAAMVARKFIDALTLPFHLDESEIFVTASIGISIYPLDGSDPDLLLRNTDAAMYSAKDSGRNNFQFFIEALNVKTQGRLEMESELRHALERGEFVIYYQPKITLNTNELVGMEALIRWNHPQRGLILPGEFIPLLEDTGLINPVGAWLLRAATTQVRQWMDAGLPPLRVAVNISPRQFLHNDLVTDVERALKASGLDADYLEIEVTETMLMHNSEHTMQVLGEIKAMGVVRIDIDDFGTGYSSLGYLKRFPISTVKIDASFVRDVPDDKEDCAIVLAVIAMAHSLGLKVVAEGVENERQLEFLRAQGCDEIQGYLVSRPLEAEAFAQKARQLTAPAVAPSLRTAG